MCSTTGAWDSCWTRMSRRCVSLNPSRRSALAIAGFALDALQPFLDDDRHHGERRHGVSPPPPRGSVQAHTRKGNGREVGAEGSLRRVCFQGATPERPGHAAARAGNHRHEEYGQDEDWQVRRG